MKNKHIALIALAASLSLPAEAQETVMSKTDVTNGFVAQTYSGRAVCHDPSVFMDTITSKTTTTYYIYGSHLGRATTTNLSNKTAWNSFGAGEERTDATNSLFANVNGTRVNYADAYSTHAVTTVKDKDGNEVQFGNFDVHKWQYTGYSIRGNEWAPDVIWNKTMKKWCMYMSVNGDRWASSIVCLTSNSPRGPWIYQGPVVFSGFQGTYDHVGFTKTKDYQHTDLEIAIGKVSSLPSRYNIGDKWGTYWPNCIDPCVFYDDDDNLWMTYGSWSGGIFMLKLNPENGLRDYEYKFPYQVNNSTVAAGAANANCTSDPYFGKKIAGGYYVSGEASYVEKIGDYYFLFMSYGGLQSDGGYQMRVFRSTKPEGPYKDIQGNSAIYSSYQMNYGSGSRTNRGVLLMGGYKWDTMKDPEIAQGHNSAFTNKNGHAMVVYHTRSNNWGEGHQVRVHELFLNEDGWLVASPYEYSGEAKTQEDIATTELFTTADIVGTYQLIRHTYCQDTGSKAYQTPVNIYLNEDGTVTGAYSGTWTVTPGTSFIALKLGTVTYKGVLTSQTMDFSTKRALCIAAVSSSSGSFTNTSNCTKGLEIWASKADAKAAISYTYKNVKSPVKEGQIITSNVTLPTAGLLGAEITWTTSDPTVISANGMMQGNGSAVLTMEIRKDGSVYRESYNVTVQDDIPTAYPEVGAKDFSTGYRGAYSEPYTLKKGEVMRFKFYNYEKPGNTQNWCNWLLCCFNNTSRSTEYFTLRADNWEVKSGSNNGCSSQFNWDTFCKDMDGALVNMTVSYTAAGKVEMSALITTTTGKEMTYTYTYPSTLSLDQVVLFFSVEKAYISYPVPVVPGDVNGDGEVDVFDVTAIAAYILDPATEGVNVKNADVNGDGVVDVFDITEVCNIILEQ